MRAWLRFDYILFFVTLALIAYGLVMIYSATSPLMEAQVLRGPVIRQAVAAVLGLALCLAVAMLDYRIFAYTPFESVIPSYRERQQPEDLGLSLHHEQWSEPAHPSPTAGLQGTIWLLAEALTSPPYMVMLILLVAVFFVGKSTLGAQRWIDLGVFDLQPSEPAKLLLILSLARYLHDHREEMDDVRHLLITGLMTALPVLLIYRQPDLGTALTLVTIWLIMIIVAGVRWRHLALLVMAAAASAPIIWTRLLSAYQKERLLIFLDPQQDPLGAGFNIIQSRISVGAGGLVGRGLNYGTQSQLHFLRVQYTDYIFAVVGEELGFVGSVLLISLYLVLMYRGVRTAEVAGDHYGQLIATGIVGMVLVQVFVNIGMNIGLTPVTGIPLPFISYGRSSLVTLLLAIGLLQSIAMHQSTASERGLPVVP